MQNRNAKVKIDFSLFGYVNDFIALLSIIIIDQRGYNVLCIGL
jgi:hypothetical protein